MKFYKAIGSLLILGTFFNCNLLSEMDLRKGKSPEYFGEDSIQLQREIKETTESIRVIEQTLKESKIKGLPDLIPTNKKGLPNINEGLENPLREKALEVLPDLQLSEIRKKIESFFVKNELGMNKMNLREKEFWNNYLNSLIEIQNNRKSK